MLKKSALFTLLFFGSLVMGDTASAGVRNTLHNLSVKGSGNVALDATGQVCFFCHAPHRPPSDSGMMWNRFDTTVTYIPYESPTLKADVGQPTGVSKLCLSCHDGTVALGSVRSKSDKFDVRGSGRFMVSKRSRLGVDLRDDHPISFRYDSALVAENDELVNPFMLTGAVQLDRSGQVQCTSCHSAHDNTYGKFLLTSRSGSELCLNCHDLEGWGDSYHATSEATWSGGNPKSRPDSGFESVRENGCENCHRSHGAGSLSWLLREAKDEENCLSCHDGKVAEMDIRSEITKGYAHSVQFYTGVHAPNEDASLPMQKHVACDDCHDPHQVTDRSAVAPEASGRLEGVSGISDTGQFVENVNFEYQVCFKCHAQYPMTDPAVDRKIIQIDKSQQFSMRSPSYHPVVGIGANEFVPSLMPEYTEQSIIYCTDCHANDTGPGAGGEGPAGPHGSLYSHLLEREYVITDGSNGADIAPYALCYKCHNIESILDDESFKSHDKHIREESTSCSTCHDPHGISDAQGNSTNNSNLINFDITTVLPDSTGRLEFIDTGDFSGECYLNCHGIEHDVGADAGVGEDEVDSQY